MKKSAPKNRRNTPLEKTVTAASSRPPLWLWMSMLLLLGTLIYSNSFDCSFHLDDKNNIMENASLRDLSQPGKIWSESKLGKTRLIPYLSFALNYRFGKLDVWGYHLVNLLIHLVNACLVFWLTRLVFRTPNLIGNRLARHGDVIALTVAFLFVSHPLATQSVTYIVQRMASMAAMFYFLSVALYIKARLCREGAARRRLLLIGALLAGAFAMFSKENAFTLPLMIALVELVLFRSIVVPKWLSDFRYLPLVLLLAGIAFFGIIRFASGLFESIPPTGGNHFTVTPASYLFTQFPVIVTYIRMLVLPFNQNLDHDVRMAESLFELPAISSLLFLLFLVYLGIRFFDKAKLFTFGIFWFFIALSVESSVIPIEDLMFEHRTYLPSFGFFLAATSGVFHLLWEKQKGVAIALFVVVIGTNSMLTFQRNKVWRSELTLWTDALTKSPDKARPFLNRGVANWDSGKREQALVDYQRAVELSPGNYTNAYFNLAVAQESFGQFDQSILNYSKVIAINPFNSEAYSGRGVVYSKKGMADEAISDFTTAISKRPDAPGYYFNRGNVFMGARKWKEAESDFNEAIRLAPGYVDAIINRATVYGMTGETDKAIADCSRAISLDPNSAKALYNRAVTYFNAGKWSEAIADYSSFLRLVPGRIDALFNRGVAYSNSGQFEQAISDFDKVLETDPGNQSAMNSRAVAASRLSRGS